MALPCCPSGSHGPLPPDEDALTGWWQKLADLDCYCSGQKEKPSMILVAFPDVFGAYSGRHRKICDEMAAAVPGSLVCMPDLFRGDPICADYAETCQWAKFWLKMSLPKMIYRIRYTYGWGKIGPEIQRLVEALRGEIASVPMYSYGFCFGGYVAVKASSTGAFSGAVGFHPSLLIGKLQCSPHRENDADLGKGIRCPQLMIPAWNDDAAVKPGGEFMNLAMAAYPASKSVPYESMAHGWMTRGAADTMVPQTAGVESVKECQASALKLAAEFFLQLAGNQSS